jgi:hypothetical protein
MLIQTKIQIAPEDYNFVKKSYKNLKYKSLSEYMRSAVQARIREDRLRLREMERKKAMEMIGRAGYENIF